MGFWPQLLLSGLALSTQRMQAFSEQVAASSQTSEASPQFTVPVDATLGATILPNVLDPTAVRAQDVCPGYIASAVETSSTGLRADLTLAGGACNVYGTDVERLQLLVEYQTDQRLHLNIHPTYVGSKNQSWFLLSNDYVPSPSQEDGKESTSDLAFTWSNEPSFGFNVTRQSTNETLFSTIGKKLVFEDQYIEFVTSMESGYNLYGLGEVIHALRLGNNFTRTIYAADAGDPIDGNIYGSHPFFLQTNYYTQDTEGNMQLITDEDTSDYSSANSTSRSHGVYLRNAHGMEVLMNANNVTWRTLGGSIDLYFYSGPTQPDVTHQYLQQVGMPALQQYWTFGFHQCRWGYHNWTETEAVVEAYRAFDIPLETIWNDIDYMTGYRDFTNDPIRFSVSEGQAFLERLSQRGQHYIPIIDSAIYIPNPQNESDAYEPFNRGNDTGSFLLNPDGSLYIGDVWPGYTVFPDWETEAAQQWWKDEISRWYKDTPFSGIWIDMSEASSFCVGSCGSNNLSLNPVHPPFKLGGEKGSIIYDYPEGFNLTNATAAASASSASSAQASSNSASLTATATTTSSTASTAYLKTTPTPGVRNVVNPPYAINNINGALDVHAVSPNATHHTGIEEYDVHNLFGHQILQNTYAALLNVFPGLRPFIIGRSTFVGSQKYAGHWGGDNTSLWAYLFFSIPQALSFSLFGFPMFGVDTCGFNGNSDEELCNRWMQLSAFFPFYRNHNTLSANSQEAYVWASVIEATKAAMNVRFQLLPYMYTLFYYAHTRGDTVMRALAWEFPNDPSLASADRQFFLGPSILVTPVLVQGASSVNGVFPGLMEGTDVYYDWFNQSAVSVPSEKNTTISAPLGHIPVYLRGGTVLATQGMALTTRDARETPWSLIVAPGKDGCATGSLYLDDGVSLQPNATKMVNMVARDGMLNVTVQGDYSGLNNPLANITVLGVDQAPTNGSVKINGQAVTDSSYDAETKKLVLTNLQDVLNGQAWAESWTLQYQ